MRESMLKGEQWEYLETPAVAMLVKKWDIIKRLKEIAEIRYD